MVPRDAVEPPTPSRVAVPTVLPTLVVDHDVVLERRIDGDEWVSCHSEFLLIDFLRMIGLPELPAYPDARRRTSATRAVSLWPSIVSQWPRLWVVRPQFLYQSTSQGPAATAGSYPLYWYRRQGTGQAPGPGFMSGLCEQHHIPLRSGSLLSKRLPQRTLGESKGETPWTP